MQNKFMRLVFCCFILFTNAVTAAGSTTTLVVRSDAKVSFATRLSAARHLGENLSQSDLQAIYSFLGRIKDDDVLTAAQLNALKNDVVNTVLAQQNPPRELSSHLTAMYNNSRHDLVWRDYCVQFLADCHSFADTVKERKQIEEALWAAATKDWPISGTALISLSRLGKKINQEQVVDRALEIAGDEEASVAARITALQICANADSKDVLPVARQLADSDNHVPLRVSAIGAIGLAGDASDLELVAKFQNSSDTRLRGASRAATERIQGRN